MSKKIVWITGASAGFGAATALRMAKEGHTLALFARRREKLELVAQQCEALGSKTEVFILDVRNADEVSKQTKNAFESLGTPDVLVNNAGLALGLDRFDQANPEHWNQMIDTNIKGLLYMGKAAADYMVKAGRGHIVNIGSLAGKEVYPGGHVYCATKHAVEAITKGMRQDLFKFGIRVSQISPGLAETEFSIVRFEGNIDRAKAVYHGIQPLTAEDIAECIAFVIHQPPHVCIHDIVLTPTAQATSTLINRSQV
ncbi:short-chain dehydrogenase [Thermaurantimonas aggregans]|uniref:Short-chain dehydrogenase n=1 Tax=Thermaurantimonas aggregans TaxID=2173829 RepID=A0A401XJ82_9FLAO|nr:SDR family NAD(P)-dependent oxidoreductase [Thermaurantimonas aggregans]MCX8147839.1 SDR family NAD(P)-dependent oxidoreductase [Thermaurantimonas aggregans]GCD77085.1 short-chain dehydrogenase [Thermaurantimonas aggregans]